MVPIRLLGQAGVRLELGGVVVYIDPYLTDHVWEVEQAEDLHRLVPAPVLPEEVRDADFVLVTHAHLDHCDPTTLGPIAKASPKATFLCPNECRPILHTVGILPERIVTAPTASTPLGEGLTVRAVPASHPTIERDDEGHLRCVGYVLDLAGRRFYHAGDTSPAAALIEGARQEGPIEVAFLPVNECNYYRNRRGIIGNMSLREAFQLAEDLGVRHLVPIHWDMFAPNRVYPEEIELLARLVRPSFQLHMTPEAL